MRSLESDTYLGMDGFRLPSRLFVQYFDNWLRNSQEWWMNENTYARIADGKQNLQIKRRARQHFLYK